MESRTSALVSVLTGTCKKCRWLSRSLRAPSELEATPASTGHFGRVATSLPALPLWRGYVLVAMFFSVSEKSNLRIKEGLFWLTNLRHSPSWEGGHGGENMGQLIILQPWPRSRGRWPLCSFCFWFYHLKPQTIGFLPTSGWASALTLSKLYSGVLPQWFWTQSSWQWRIRRLFNKHKFDDEINSL